MDVADTRAPEFRIRGRLPRRVRVGLFIASAVAAVIVTLAAEPADAPMSYYRFAGDWRVFGIPNILNVVSNLPFLIAGTLGLAFVLGREGRGHLTRPAERWPYLVFFAGVTATTLGSGFFHLEPLLADGSLHTLAMLGDRIPITIAFTGLFAAFIADRVSAKAGLIALPLLVAFGVGACVYWYASYGPGGGDLRPYALVQSYPALAIPLICWLFAGRHTHGRYVVYTLAFYGVAKVAETYDTEVYMFLGETISGHVIKHLLAAAAAWMVLAMLRHTARRAAEPAKRAEA